MKTNIAVNIGIDIGASKTKVRIETLDGKLLLQFYKDGLSFSQHPKEEWITQFDHLINPLETQYECKAIGVGVAGLSAQSDITELTDFFTNVYNHLFYFSSDAEIALFDALEENSGVLLILGTGSITYGQTTYNEQVRTGGWGYLFDYNSGAYSLGKAFINSLIWHIEQKESNTQFINKFNEHFKILDTAQGIKNLYKMNAVKEIADLAPIILDLAEEGNEKALIIIKQFLANLREQLNFFCELHHFPIICPLYFTGGLIEKSKFLQKIVSASFESDDHYKIESFYVDAAKGALNLVKTKIK